MQKKSKEEYIFYGILAISFLQDMKKINVHKELTIF